MYLHITEEVSVNTVVGSIPIKPGFTYRFNTEEDLFSLDPISGVITTKGRIDRESSNIGKTGQFDLIVLSSSPTYPIEVRSLASYLWCVYVFEVKHCKNIKNANFPAIISDCVKELVHLRIKQAGRQLLCCKEIFLLHILQAESWCMFKWLK